MKGAISMLTLDLPRGVRVEIRPVTTAVMTAAHATAARGLALYDWGLSE
jgi:hypothetical protein